MSCPLRWRLRLISRGLAYLTAAALLLAGYGYGALVFDSALAALGGEYRFSVRAPAGRCYGWHNARASELRCYPAPTQTPTNRTVSP